MRRPSLGRSIVASSAALLACAGAVHAAPVILSIKDLGTLGGTVSQAAGYSTLNASGQVAAYSTIGSGSIYHATRFAVTNGVLSSTDLGVIAANTNSYAYSINASGQIAGVATVSGGASHAVRSPAAGVSGSLVDLGTLGGTTSYAYGINSSGQVVGYSSNGTQYHAYRTAANSTITAGADLGTFGGIASYAYGINDSGQVVGTSFTTNNLAEHAFRTSGTLTAASDIGTLGGTTSIGYAINASGQVVGTSTLTGDAVSHAFRTTATGSITASTDLGTLGGGSSYAYAINTAGQTVGYSRTAANVTHAFFVDITGDMIDLNALLPQDSGWTLQYATGINDNSQISGYGLINGQTHAFLLTIPEPTTMGLLALTAIGLLRRRRR